MRKLDGCGSDESGGLFADPYEDIGDAVEDVDVPRIQHLLSQLVVRNVNLGKLQVTLAEANLGWGRREGNKDV